MALIATITVMWAYGWLWPAWAALRRAARIGRLRRAFYCGLSIALAFIGSLFGGFWAATSLWRSYFFDPRIVPLIVVAVGWQSPADVATRSRTAKCVAVSSFTRCSWPGYSVSP